jgi:hypothetical protein
LALVKVTKRLAQALSSRTAWLFESRQRLAQALIWIAWVAARVPALFDLPASFAPFWGAIFLGASSSWSNESKTYHSLMSKVSWSNESKTYHSLMIKVRGKMR